MRENIVEIENLYFNYGDFPAVKGVSFTVKRGEIFGLLGPNGAGKSTIIKILTTLLRPRLGRVRVAGFDVVKEPSEVRKRISLLMQERGADFFLNVYDNLYFYAGLHRIPRKERRTKIDELIDIFGLAEKRYASLDTLSGGLLRRMMIARIFLSEAEVVFLDEPTAGVDIKSRADFWKLLQLQFVHSSGIAELI